nr:N-acetylmuramoyl-L-alanine amidase family protein [Lacrimispora amygdalina]
MYKEKLVKKLLIASMPVVMALSTGSLVYANTQALPNGTITSQNGTKYLTDSTGEKYSGWFIDSKEDWYYFNESDKAMKTGWHHDDKDGYWYYLNLSDGKMVTGWQAIDGKEYFFQPVRDMGNYHFNNEQERWLYSVNSKVPYGAMYVSTTTPDGSKVDNTGAKVITVTTPQIVNDNSSSVTSTVKNGWVSENGKWYYYESGILAKNKWLNLGGKWYYVLSDGVMVSNTWKELDGKSYYFGADGAMYVNTTTPDGKKVNQLGVVIEEEVKPTKINYANTLEGTFIPTAEYESYKWWTENGDTVINDERINNYGCNDYDRMALAVTYYPELEDLYWTETSISSNEFLTTAEQGFMGKFLIGGSIIWKGNDIATLVYDRNSGSGELKVLDSNTIQINGDKLIRVK